MVKTDTVTLFDGSVTKIKYSYPENEHVNKLVIYVNGSGQNTYDNKRKNPKGGFFNYHDYFRNEFLSHNVAYCSYNTRGIDIGEIEPLYVSVNEDEYKKYKPLNSVRDVESIIRYLTDLPVFHTAKVYLLGWSEGTIIASLVALRKNVRVDALLLAGYCNENLKDILIWQLSGNTSYISLTSIFGFDKDKKGYITKDEYDKADTKIKEIAFSNLPFEGFDVNSDGKIDVSDIASLEKPYLDSVLDAVARNDDEWIQNYYGNNIIKLTAGWFNEHFSLEPNKNILPQLDLPIHIFHGENDANCSVSFAEDIRNDFLEKGKTNLSVHIFASHDHDLNFTKWLIYGNIPEGIQSIFDTVNDL